MHSNWHSSKLLPPPTVELKWYAENRWNILDYCHCLSFSFPVSLFLFFIVRLIYSNQHGNCRSFDFMFFVNCYVVRGKIEWAFVLDNRTINAENETWKLNYNFRFIIFRFLGIDCVFHLGKSLFWSTWL